MGELLLCGGGVAISFDAMHAVLPATLSAFSPACPPACLPACLPARLPACLSPFFQTAVKEEICFLFPRSPYVCLSICPDQPDFSR
jgi:hypothetical protein